MEETLDSPRSSPKAERKKGTTFHLDGAVYTIGRNLEVYLLASTSSDNIGTWALFLSFLRYLQIITENSIFIHYSFQGGHFLENREKSRNFLWNREICLSMIYHKSSMQA